MFFWGFFVFADWTHWVALTMCSYVSMRTFLKSLDILVQLEQLTCHWEVQSMAAGWHQGALITSTSFLFHSQNLEFISPGDTALYIVEEPFALWLISSIMLAYSALNHILSHVCNDSLVTADTEALDGPVAYCAQMAWNSKSFLSCSPCNPADFSQPSLQHKGLFFNPVKLFRRIREDKDSV